jgi:hypothetical protein
MGLDSHRATGAVRLSVGLFTTDSEIRHAARALATGWGACVGARVSEADRMKEI